MERLSGKDEVSSANIKNYILKNKNSFPNKRKIVQIKKNNKNLIYFLDENNTELIIDLNFSENEWLKKEVFTIGELFFVEIFKRNLIIRQIPNVNGAIIVLNPHSGDVLAMSGGFSFNLSQFNRSTQAKRQPGSAFKPFVYITALNEGLTHHISS